MDCNGTSGEAQVQRVEQCAWFLQVVFGLFNEWKRNRSLQRSKQWQRTAFGIVCMVPVSCVWVAVQCLEQKRIIGPQRSQQKRGLRSSVHCACAGYVHCAVLVMQHVMCIVKCLQYTLCSMCTVQCVVCNVRFENVLCVQCLQCAVCIVRCALCTVFCALSLYTVQCALSLCTVTVHGHFAVYSVQRAVCCVQCLQCAG